jgi:hypothetical protein
MRRFMPVLAATLLAGPAFANEMPNLIPAHDVSGTYLINGKDGAKTVTVEYSKSANVLRINPQSDAGYILYDFGAKDAKMVMPQMQRYMDRPEMADRAEALEGKASGDDVSVVKGGTETIAGHDCTDYTVTNKTKGTSSTLCVTSDGVLLKLSSSEGGSIVAQSLSYNAVPASDVQVPPGYSQFVMPQMPAGMGNMSNMAPGAMGNMAPSAMGGMQNPGGAPQ